MDKYRKKPVIIDAEQWFKNGDVPEANTQREFYPCKPDIFKLTYEKV
jgi:hypothetical protein